MGLSIRSINVAFGPQRILQDISLDVADGEFLSLIGPNGAGKTTLLNAISGRLPTTSGRILCNDTDITTWKEHRRARFGIGRSFQITNLFPNLSVLQNVSLAISAHEGVPWTKMFARTPKSIVERSKHYVEQVGLSTHATKPAIILSHGDKRKLEIAMLLALEPSVLLLDEPTAGMAVAEVPAMLELISEIKAQKQYAIVFVEHKMDVVMRLSDRIAVLQNGRLLAEGLPETIIANEEVQTAYLGGTYEHAT